MWRFLQIPFILILLVACDQVERPNSGAALSAKVDRFSCDIALAGFQQQRAYPDRLKRLQQHAKQVPDLSNLEQLGWAYSSLAKEWESPEHHYLAGQVADCIDLSHGPRQEAKLLRAHTLHQQHQFADAQTMAAELVAERGLWFDHAVHGDALLEQGKLDQAAQAYQQMVDQKPGPEAYGRIGQFRWLSGDLAGAIEMFSLAVRSTSSRDDGASAFWRTRLAHLLWVNRQDTAADALLTEVLNRLDTYTPALHLRAKILLGKDRYRQAQEILDRVVAIREEPEYLWSLWEALNANGETVRADEVEKRLIELGSRDDQRTVSLFLSTRKNEAQQAKLLAEKESLKRRDAQTLDALALALLQTDHVEQADTVIHEALATGLIDPRLFLHATIISNRQGEKESANRWLERAQEYQHLLLPSERKILNRLSTHS